MSPISRGTIAAEAAPQWFFLIIRALLLLASGGVVSMGLIHNVDAVSLVAEGAPAVAAITWSAFEKWQEAKRLHLAIAAPAGLAQPPLNPPALPAGLIPPKEPIVMSSKFDFSTLAAAAGAKLKELAPDVAPEFADALTSAVAEAAADAKTFVDAEIETATHQVPPALQPLAPQIEELLDAGISEAQAEADAKIAKLAAAKASLAPAATPAPADDRVAVAMAAAAQATA